MTHFTTPEGRQWLIDMLKSNEVTIKFTKVGGEERIMHCTLKDDAITPYEKKTDRPTKHRSDDVIAVWDLDNDGWRSFRLDSITEVNLVLE